MKIGSATKGNIVVEPNDIFSLPVLMYRKTFA